METPARSCLRELARSRQDDRRAPMSKQELINILGRFADQRIAIIGDAIADRFVYGSISRVSREAPVFILQHQHTETSPGGAANCAMNLVALGAKVSLIS